ncbi:MAG: tetratricopeptide repeat protein [Terriglobales bacterium]
MRRLLLLAVIGFSSWTFAQQQSPPANDAPPRSDTEEPKTAPGESSSRDTRIDLSPPKDDDKSHPKSGAAPESGDQPSDVHELHPFNPYRATKDNEVGDYYYKRKNYKAALARYQDALAFKQNDAVANFRMAQCYEKLDQPDDAITHFKEYLKILPQGPLAKDARKELEKLEAAEQPTSEKTTPK